MSRNSKHSKAGRLSTASKTSASGLSRSVIDDDGVASTGSHFYRRNVLDFPNHHRKKGFADIDSEEEGNLDNVHINTPTVQDLLAQKK